MRRKYVRFFVSSTFIDMKMERNILQDVFSELNAEYSKQGWQIDAVDLRWGISKEAGLENNTMRICKEELLHCQQLSPKPNFIILSGGRYGWVPLPEVVPADVYETLQMTPYEDSQFHFFYSLDRNYLPDGAYVLRSRRKTGHYEYDLVTDEFTAIDYSDEKVWNHGVVKTLGEMFERNGCNLYGKSATEQEIELGAFSVDDADEHVIAYIRHLHSIPEDEKCVYLEPDKQNKINDLQDRINDRLADENILSVDLSYDEYVSSEYANDFKVKMKDRISSVINNVIDENKSCSLTENQIHIEHALELSSEFIGRDDELRLIQQYLYDDNADCGLWFLAESGVGKSTLLAKVAELYRNDFNVVCRFCGLSGKSANAETLFNSIYEDIVEMLDLKRYFDYLFEPNRVNCFQACLDKYSLSKPLLLIIDAIDNADDSTWRGFNALQWLDCSGKKGIKVIISSAPQIKYRISLPFLRKLELKNLGSEAMKIVFSQLESANRTLTEEQIHQLADVIEKSDKSFLYLKTLGRMLIRFNSEDDLSILPHTLPGLVQYYCRQLASPAKHGEKLVYHILFWLATARTGIVEKEIPSLLAYDIEYVNDFKDNSMHDLCTKESHIEIPPIILMRLLNDLAPLIQYEYKFKIASINFRHPEFKRAVLEMFEGKKRLSDYLYYLLYVYYTCIYPNRHSLIEGPNYLVKAFKQDLIPVEELLEHMESNLDYIVNKMVEFPGLLIDDYDAVMASVNSPEIRRRLNAIKDQICSVQGFYTNEDIKMAMRNLPLSSPLRAAVENSGEGAAYMDDIIAYTPDVGSLYVINSLGESPVMSYDGKIIASLKENGYRIDVGYLENPEKNFLWEFSIPHLELLMDDSANLIAARAEDECCLIDLNKKKEIAKIKMESHGWISMDANGCFLVIGGPSGRVGLYNVLSGQVKIYTGAKHAKISPSGKYIWIIDNLEGKLLRFDIAEENSIALTTVLCSDWIKENGGPRILSCSDECCVIGNYFYRINFVAKRCDLYLMPESPVLLQEHPPVYVHRNLPMYMSTTGTCMYIDDDYCIQKLGHIFLDQLHCLNGDFTIALSASQKRVFDFRKELNQFRCTRNSGLSLDTGFSLSVNCYGDQASVSSYGGIGTYGEENLRMLRVNRGSAYGWSPYHERECSCHSFTATAVSPDGEVFAVAVFRSHEILIVNSENDNVEHKIALPFDVDEAHNIGKLVFSADAEYLIVSVGPYITSDKDVFPINVYVYDLLRKEFLGSVVNIQGGKYDEIILSPCSRYLSSSGSVYDMVEDRYNLLPQSVETLEDSKYLAAISASGLNYYYVKSNSLYVRNLNNINELRLLRHHVRNVYPGYDDRFIYILDSYAHYILFDTVLGKDIQTTTQGSSQFCAMYGAKVCFQGLLVFNAGTSRLSLFKPDDKYKVNRPAYTTFVRRWDLGEKVLKEPSAVCPACGGLIEYKDFQSCKLKDYDTNAVCVSDWDDPSLKGHDCPHCRSEIQFTPYVV